MLILVFALSATPKKFLHDWTAHHTDQKGKFTGDSRDHVQKNFFSCHIEDLVVESPFTENKFRLVLTVPVPAGARYAALVTRWLSARVIYSSLRGPPAHTLA